jgi:hypothetical protein
MSPGNAEQQLAVTPAQKGGVGEEAPSGPQQRVLEIFGALADVLPYDQPVYRRTITTRPVTFTCVRCAQTVTQQRFPGPVPRYCGPWCQRQAQQAQTRERVRRHRARTRALPEAP